MADPPLLHRRRFAASGDVHLRVLVAGWCRLGAWWHEQHVDQPLWRLYANEEVGAEISLADGRIVTLDPGRIWLLPAGLSFTCRAHALVGHLWVHFDPAGLSPGSIRDLGRSAIALPSDPAQTEACAAVRSAAQDPAVDDIELRCLAKSLAYLAFARWWRTLTAEVRARLLLTSSDPGLAPALRRIESDIASPLYNQSLARSCHLSPSTFVRRFHAATGVPPAQYILDRRIAFAAEQLLLGQQGIAEIATASGFSDRYYFSRVFAKRMRCSPAAYRAHQPGKAAG